MIFCSFVWAGDRVLVIAPDHHDFVQVYDAIRSNASDLQFDYLQWDERLTPQEGVKHVESFQPNLIVLMDNKAIRLYRQMLHLSDSHKVRPVVALMALQMEQVLRGIPNAVGISYEIPAVTTVSHLRMLLKDSIRRVGVVYRKEMESFYHENHALCQVERIELVGRRIDQGKVDVKTLRRALHSLKDEQTIDAVWIINDNTLLTPQLIRDAWIPYLKENPMPGIVGVETLLQTRLSLGMLAVVPDPSGIGAQVANLIYEAMDNGWKWNALRIEKPLSVQDIVNVTMARRVAKPRDNLVNLVDRTVE